MHSSGAPRRQSGAPAIRAGLSVQELKAMTAMRVGSSDEQTSAYSRPQSTTSSYQTATPQQLRAAGIQAVVHSSGRQMTHPQQQQQYANPMVSPRGYGDYTSETPTYVPGYGPRMLGGSYIDAPNSNKARPSGSGGSSGGASVEDLKELTRIRLMKEREAQLEQSLAAGLPTTSGKGSTLSSYATATSASTAVVYGDHAYLQSRSGSAPQTPRSDSKSNFSGHSPAHVHPVSQSFAPAPSTGLGLSSASRDHTLMARGSTGNNSLYENPSMRQMNASQSTHKQRHPADHVIPPEAEYYGSNSLDASSYRGWGNSDKSMNSIAGPVWDHASSTSFDPASGSVGPSNSSSRSNVFSGIQRSSSSRAFGPEDNASMDTFSRETLAPSSRLESFDLHGISSDALVHGNASLIRKDLSDPYMLPERLGSADERNDAANTFSGIASGPDNWSLSYSTLQTGTNDNLAPSGALPNLPPLEVSPTMKPRIGAFVEPKAVAGLDPRPIAPIQRCNSGIEASAGPKTLKPIPPRLAFASSPSTVPGVPGQGASINLDSPIPKLRSRQNSGASLGRQDSADLNILASEVAELVLDYTPQSTPKGGGSPSKFVRQNSGSLVLGGQSALMSTSPDIVAGRGYCLTVPELGNETSASTTPSQYGAESGGRSHSLTPGSHRQGQSRFFPDTSLPPSSSGRLYLDPLDQ